MDQATPAGDARHVLKAARAVAAFLSDETGLRFQPLCWNEALRAAIVGFDSVAGRHHRVAFSEELLTELSDDEIREILRAWWLPGQLLHPAYQPLLVTSEGLSDLQA